MHLWDAVYRYFKEMHLFLVGAGFSLYIVAGLLFLRFYRRTRDRLFLYFSAALFIMGVNRLIFMSYFVVNGDAEPPAPIPYLIRLAAFLLIIFAIIDKNRRRSAPRP
jgi:hypothetical protein